MLRRSLLGSLLLSMMALLAALTACGDDDAKPAPDAGAVSRDAAVDARVADAASLLAADCSGDLPVMKARDVLDSNIESDPDWSCYAGAEEDIDLDAGQDGATRTVTLHVAPLPQIWFAGATVDLFFGPSTLGTPSRTGVFDANASDLTFEVPSAIRTVSARVHAKTGAPEGLSVVETREYGVSISSTDSIEAIGLIKDSRALAIDLALGGGHEDPAKAVILASVRDCRGRPVSGAQFELIDDATNMPVPTGTAAGAVRSVYLQFALPKPTCTFTSNEQQDSGWMMVNAPVNVKGEPRRMCTACVSRVGCARPTRRR